MYFIAHIFLKLLYHCITKGNASLMTRQPYLNDEFPVLCVDYSFRKLKTYHDYLC